MDNSWLWHTVFNAKDGHYGRKMRVHDLIRASIERFLDDTNMTTLPTALIALVAVLNGEDEVLLLKRGSGVHCPDVWSFPGGKAEANEEPLHTAIRELKEETNINGKLWRHMGKHQHTYPDKNLFFSFFFCRFDQEKNTLKAESEHMWCSLERLKTLDMPDANTALIDMLLEYHQQDLLPS